MNLEGRKKCQDPGLEINITVIEIHTERFEFPISQVFFAKVRALAEKLRPQEYPENIQVKEAK